MKNLFSLKGKVALVTGASRGLGFAMAEAMADYGAHVVMNGRHKKTLDPKVKKLLDKKLPVSGAVFDVAEPAACVKAVADVIKQHGHLDILINNAGTAEYSPVTDYPLEMWNRLLNIHLTGAFVLAREAGRHMADRGKGTIINIGSIAGPKIAVPNMPAYATAKAGLEGLTRALAVELGPKGVTANCIAPGYFHTELGGSLKEGEPPPDAATAFYRMVEEHTPLRRWAKPGEIAGLTVFLASDAASYMNGSVIYIDGGMSVLQ
ncbi:MAG: SDR family oxidoreductase [Alphaproteobacteria bacterium]|nr:SDR family oxidoreductase [Alphaproteobacteria bacterium]